MAIQNIEGERHQLIAESATSLRKLLVDTEVLPNYFLISGAINAITEFLDAPYSSKWENNSISISAEIEGGELRLSLGLFCTEGSFTRNGEVLPFGNKGSGKGISLIKIKEGSHSLLIEQKDGSVVEVLREDGNIDFQVARRR